MKVKMCLKKKESVALNHRRHRSSFHEDHNQSKHRRKRKNPPKMKNFVYDRGHENILSWNLVFSNSSKFQVILILYSKV